MDEARRVTSAHFLGHRLRFAERKNCVAVFRRKVHDKRTGKVTFSRFYSYDFWVAGRRYRGGLPEARTKAQAERAENKIRDSVYEGKYGKTVEAPTLAEFVKKTYLPYSKQHKRSWKHDDFRSRPLVASLGKYKLDEISQLLIEKYKRERRVAKSKRGTDLTPASINREIELLSAVFTHAINLGVLTGENPCRKVRRFDEDNQRTRILLREEEKRLLEQLVGKRAHLGPIVQLAIHTMLRRSELLSLRKENLDFERDLILVTNAGGQKTKSKKSRLVPMNSAARQILLGLCRASATEYVFPNKKTGGYIKDVKTAFTAACEDAKVNDLRFHDLRRTGAPRLGEGGADAFYTAAILGHADVNTSQVYTVATNAGLRRAMETLTLVPGQTDAIVPTQEERRPLPTAVNS